jgi:hypothetical protein
MKLIKYISNNEVLLLLQDDATIDFSKEYPFIDQIYYSSFSEKDVEVVEDCGAPSSNLTDLQESELNFYSHKFIYTDAWAFNPEWIDPVEESAEDIIEEPVV